MSGYRPMALADLAGLRAQRADTLVRAPAAFREHGVCLSVRDLEAG
jgi:hypothetical protein